MLDDAPQSGGPVEVDSDQSETLAKNNQCSPKQEVADIFKCPNQYLLVKMKTVFYFMKKTKQTFWPTQYIIALEIAEPTGDVKGGLVYV